MRCFPIEVAVPKSRRTKDESTDTPNSNCCVEDWNERPGAVEAGHNPRNKDVALCDTPKMQKEHKKSYQCRNGSTVCIRFGRCMEAMCERNDINLVYIATDWKHHAEMGVYAMEHGKHVAIEVPSAMTLDEIWALINTSEKTRKHCMQLENCVYDFFELTTLNMAQQGLFGEVLHVEGAYIDNLEEFWPYYWNNWRLDYNNENRGDVYATHGLGPACQLLDIHRGDRMKTLVAMDTKAATGPKLGKRYGWQTIYRIPER